MNPAVVSHRYVSDAWKEAYANPDWENIPPTDLWQFVFDGCRLSPSKIQNILDIGCGCGTRLLYAIIKETNLNRNDVAMIGIDIVADAITRARENYLDAANERSKCSAIAAEQRQSVVVRATYVQGDILSPPSEVTRGGFDLVVDWMCFHESSEGNDESYVDLIATICRKFFVLKVFSKENAKTRDLPKVAGKIVKRQFSQEDIERLFGRDFIIVRSRQYEEVANPDPPHSDGIEAAKRAYLLRRKP